MVKTSEQIKNIIEDWIKITGIKYEDISQKQDGQSLEWVFQVGPSMIIYMTKRQDRINLETQINFAPEHQEATANMPDRDFLEFTNEINEHLLLAGLQPVYKQTQKRIEAMKIIGYVDVESLSREHFFKIFDKVTGFNKITINKVQIKFGIKGNFDPFSSSSTKAGPYG